jgi:hypothetical protein
MTGNDSAITASITALLAIMSDESESMRRRIDSAAALLSHETPELVAERAKGFLTTLLEDRNRIMTDHRLEAAQLLRKAESPKIAQQSVRSVAADQWRETWRKVAIGLRRVKLDKAGLWPAPSDWANDLLAADYEPRPPSKGER